MSGTGNKRRSWLGTNYVYRRYYIRTTHIGYDAHITCLCFYNSYTCVSGTFLLDAHGLGKTKSQKKTLT